MQALPNFEVGIDVKNSASNAISGNLISANGISGIELFGQGSSNNSISSNLIGGNAQGQVAFRGTSRTTSFCLAEWNRRLLRPPRSMEWS